MANPVGKPPWIPTPEIIKKAEEYAALGLTKAQIASCLGIHYDTLNNKTKQYDDFNDAIKRGLDRGIAKYANLLLEHAKDGNSSSVIFFLKARAKWSDNAAVDELHAKIDAIAKAMETNKNGEINHSEKKENS